MTGLSRADRNISYRLARSETIVRAADGVHGVVEGVKADWRAGELNHSLRTGRALGKGVANALSDTAVSTASLGFADDWDAVRFDVTGDDFAHGYDAFYLTTRVGAEVGLMFATGGGSAAVKSAG